MPMTALKMTKEMIDYLIKRTADGDMDALRQLYEEFKTPVYLISLTIVKDQSLAEDILQETFIGLKANASTYTQGTNGKAWILAIAKNMSKNCLRKRHYEIQDPFMEDDDGSNTYAKCIVNDDLLEGIVISEKLSALEKDEKQIVVLHVFSGLKLIEIAGLLELPYGTVLWKYSKALGKLRKLYNEDFNREGVDCDK